PHILLGWDLPKTTTKDPSQKVPLAACNSYPLEEEFQNRAKQIITALSTANLETWRKGYFSKGDPGKYLPLHAMAKLIINPDDQEAIKYMNDDRSYREHYHFAAVNWARFIPIFSPALTQETIKKFELEASKYTSYIKMGGTENHKVMWWTSANVLPYYIDNSKFANMNKEEALKIAKATLRKYVKGLFEAGQGEWDSSTYLVFDVNGMLNIYDFSQDEECRLLAKAALDWYLSAYALKYRDGLFCAPHQRGFCSTPYESLMDQNGYLWWAGNKKLSNEECKNFRYTIHAITSSYRPNKIITNIALKKDLNFPIEQLNTKPNYWHGQGIEWVPGIYYETFFVGNNYSMGSLWNGHGSQISRFQIVVTTNSGAVSFTGGTPRKSDHNGKKIDFGYTDGIGRYDQSVQVGPVYISMSKIPDQEEYDYTFFSFPESFPPSRYNDWFVFDIEKTFIGLKALGGAAEISKTDLTEKEKNENEKEISKGKPEKHKAKPIIKISGRNVGFLIQCGESTKFKSLEEFKKALDRTSCELANFAKGKLTYIDIDGRKIEMKFSPVNNGDNQSLNYSECIVNGEKIDPQKWNIYTGPLLHQEKSVLTVSDGKDSFTIDFSGDLPVYK
ncbi:MAG TPA: hypothetical protein P5105_05320, partial [Victivallales bacterium]|nr:hypothetical protein [Victivallales bacterium]